MNKKPQTTPEAAPSKEEQEGIIQFEVDHRYCTLDFDLYHLPFQTLNHWRTRLYQLGLIGVDPKRYAGIGFGNLSMRLPHDPSSFLITGSQTGLLKQLDLDQYCRILKYDFQKHTLQSEGQTLPSSESMTHAMMYQIDPRIQAVFHVHSPRLWNSNVCQFPSTPDDVGYGTLAMTQCVYDLYHTTSLSQFDSTPQGGHLRMGGHQDGMISIGSHPNLVGQRLLKIWNEA